jgi:hypothetical protein
MARAAHHGRRLRDERAQGRFSRAFVGVVGALAIVAAVFLVLGVFQGPKLSSAQVDTVRVTEQTGQQLRMFANQRLDDLDARAVTVEPATSTTVTVQGDLIVIQFDERLRYATDYTVRVSGVGAPRRPNTSTFEHRFTTASASVLYLDRSDTGDDEILRAEISGVGRGEVVHRAAGIQLFAAVERVLLVSRDDGAGGSVLESVEPTSGRSEPLRLPANTRIDRFITAPSGTMVALVLSPPADSREGAPGSRPARTVALLDLAGDRSVLELTDLAGEPLTAVGAWFLPTGDLLVHTVNQELVRLNPADPSVVLPLGSYLTVFGVSSDGGRVSAADRFGGVALDLASGEEERLNPSPLAGAIPFGGELALTAKGLRVQKVALQDPDSGAISSVLVADDGRGTSRLLARTIDDRGSIGSLHLSPNDQYAVIELTPVLEGAVSDGRVVESRPTSVTLAIIDVDTGQLVRTLEGFGAVWTVG